MSGPHFVEILGRDWQVFALVWGLNLGDQLEVVDGEVRSVAEGIRSKKAVPEDAIAAAEAAGLIEFEDLEGGRVAVHVTNRGKYQLHKWGPRYFGPRKWEAYQQDFTWLMAGFNLEAAAAEAFGGKP
jgi:hypothetical protein